MKRIKEVSKLENNVKVKKIEVTRRRKERKILENKMMKNLKYLKGTKKKTKMIKR